MRILGLLVLLIVFALAFYILQYWALDFCIGISFAALCFSIALSIARKALRGREGV